GGIGRFRSGGYSTSGKVRDALMTELKEMVHYQVRTRLVGSDYRIEAGGHFVTADQDGRNADTHTIQPGMVCERDQADQGIDVPVSQALDRLGRVRSRGHRRNDETVWRADERLECAMYDHRQEVIGDLGYLQPDRVARAPHGAGGNSRAIAQLFDRGLHALPHLVAHAVGIAEHLRDCSSRNSCLTSDVCDRRRL